MGKKEQDGRRFKTFGDTLLENQRYPFCKLLVLMGDPSNFLGLVSYVKTPKCSHADHRYVSFVLAAFWNARVANLKAKYECVSR